MGGGPNSEMGTEENWFLHSSLWTDDEPVWEQEDFWNQRIDPVFWPNEAIIHEIHNFIPPLKTVGEYPSINGHADPDDDEEPMDGEDDWPKTVEGKITHVDVSLSWLVSRVEEDDSGHEGSENNVGDNGTEGNSDDEGTEGDSYDEGSEGGSENEQPNNDFSD
ncbi:hypothetical protein HDV00_006591 [Rhizophlyctis rosea]|nr:hypothetical protein HDV00_006591 [Rhizophlyctis rosea]